MALTSIPQNYKKNVDWILGAYTDAGVSFTNGFQKDAIQNSVGARKTNKWKNWNCDISLISNDKGSFLVIEDSGTVGLTGRNIPKDKMDEMMAADISLPPEDRLARFTSMFNSGGNKTGSGLFGAGKSVYSVASNDYTYYFDSLREDGKYVANVNQCGQINPLAFEDDEAKAYILQKTGFQEKLSIGTRIIIVNPQQELKDSIEDGSIIDYIQESWWLIISRFDDTCSITVNGKPVKIPERIKSSTKSFDLLKTDTYVTGYKVKHFGLYIFEDGKSPWNGISYYRKGMKIGDIELKDIPDKINGKYWGYIEVDEEWEDFLADIEDKVHFGVSKGKKNKIAYQYLKNYCNEKVKAKLVEWGYIKDKQNEDKKLNEEVFKIAEDLQDFFDEMGFEDLGKGPQKPDFDVRWQDIKFPEADTERVTSGDSISFSVRIKSSYANDKKFEYKLYIIDPSSGSIVHQIASDKIEVKSKTIEKIDFNHNINKSTSKQFSENRVCLSVKVVGSGKEKKKEFSYFYDIDRPSNRKDIVTLTLHECVMPHEGSRRVNFDETITNVNYRIENKRNHALNYKLNVSIHNAEDPSMPKIMDVISTTGIIKPFEEMITSEIPAITFSKEIFDKHLNSGVVELRARLVANQDDEQFEKGDKITLYRFKVFLNSDEKNGKSDAFDIQCVFAPDNYKRSWYTPGNGRTIFLNVGHPAYTNVKDYPDIQYEYLREQMMKQYILLYLGEGKFDMFAEPGKDFSELEPQEAVEHVIERIENIYAKSLM